MNKVTTIIQGPANIVSISNIRHYAEFGPVVLSCYTDDNLEAFKPLIPPQTIIIRESIPDIPAFNQCHIFNQVVTTLYGLIHTPTSLAIKTRSDERYNIAPFVKKLHEYPDRFVSNNIFFKGPVEPLHPSDHMFGGNTFALKAAMQYLSDICICNPVQTHHLYGELFGLPWLGAFTSETAIFLSFLWSIKKLHILNESNMHQITYDNTQLVNIDDMQPYIYSFSLNGQRYYFNTSDEIYNATPSLKSHEEFWN